MVSKLQYDKIQRLIENAFFQRLESVARYDEITTIVLNHLEPDHSGALPELPKKIAVLGAGASGSMAISSR